jgi:MFS family permease
VRARPAAIAAVFVANGLGGPSFLPRLPERQAALDLSDAALGLVLVGMAAGALAASPAAGRAVGRVGSRPVAVAAAVTLGAALWTAGAAPHPVVLFVALAGIGAADAAMDIAMNANGAAYEQRTRRSLLHRLHGAWSLGALAAAGVAAVMAAAGVSLTWHLLGVGAVVAATALVARPWMVVGDQVGDDRARADVSTATLPVTDRGGGADGPAGGDGRARADGEGGRTRRRRTRGPLLALAAVTVAGAVIEGAPSDWSALRLERLGAGPGAAALGFAAFAAGMLAGRLAGDHVTDRVGGATVLRGGMTLVAAGLVAGALVDHPAVFAVGLVVAGVGAAGLFPLAFSAAATTPGVAPGAGAATVSLAARLGFMVEPVLMGALAELVGLRAAFVVVGGVAAAVALAAPRVLGPGAAAGDAEAGTVADLRTG